MAYLELTNGKKQSISGKQGLFLWKALHDPASLDDAQAARLKQVKAVYLAWRDAPDDYIEENLKGIIPLALNDWAVNPQTGKPTRPGDDFSWKFARRWGLWENGQPTELASSGMAGLAQTSMASRLKIND